MAIKAGTFIHDIHGFVINRIQTGGVSAVNVPLTKVYELGDYNAVATIRDIPDLSFDIDSTDVSCEVESLLHGGTTPGSISNGTEFNFLTTYPVDVISPFKAGNGAYNIVKGIVVPYLTLDTVSYKFGVKANATETFTLKGDAVYYVPGSPYYQSFNLSGTGPYTLAHTANTYTESGNTIYVLSACVKNVSTGAYKRLHFGTDAGGYTNTSTTITTVDNWQTAGYTTLHVTYGSSAAATYNQSVNETASVNPGAIRSKDVLVYVGTGQASSSLVKWAGVQSVEITRKVNLQQDEELGNTHYVSIDYDTADVTGKIGVKAADATTLWNQITQVAGVSNSVVSGPITAIPVEMQVAVRHPDTGAILKTWNIPDAIFTAPGAQGKVQNKLEVSFDFTSDAGLLSVFKGAMP